jgi:hypothetical protein
MDVFEHWLDQSWQKNAKERKRITEEKRAACACAQCPTYNHCAQENRELIYCLGGKSMLCITGEVGCGCPACPVTRELGLQYHTFCIQGSEAAQRYEHEAH